MERMLLLFYGFDCRLVQMLNRHFDKKFLNGFFRFITHFGGARISISSAFLLLILSPIEDRLIAISSCLALSLSHLIVHFAKQLFPRKRPYLMLEKTKVLPNPLQDYSFPSGHTTAIFSIITPYVLFMPQFSFLLIPLGLIVGISRIYLGLHYPTDVIAGGILGMLAGSLGYILLCI